MFIGYSDIISESTMMFGANSFEASLLQASWQNTETLYPVLPTFYEEFSLVFDCRNEMNKHLSRLIGHEHEKKKKIKSLLEAGKVCVCIGYIVHQFISVCLGMQVYVHISPHYVAVLTVWNSLPASVKSEGNTVPFRQHLKTYLCNAAYPP